MNTELSNARMWPMFAQIDEAVNKGEVNEIVIDTDQLPTEEWLSKQTKVDYIFIKGSRIRYFHLPDQTDINNSIEVQLEVYRNRRKKSTRPFNWKSYRKRLKLTESVPQPSSS